MNRHDLTTDTANTLAALNEKVRAALDLGKPGEAADYSTALQNVAIAYDALNPDTTDDD